MREMYTPYEQKKHSSEGSYEDAIEQVDELLELISSPEWFADVVKNTPREKDLRYKELSAKFDYSGFVDRAEALLEEIPDTVSEKEHVQEFLEKMKNPENFAPGQGPLPELDELLRNLKSELEEMADDEE